MNINGIPHYLVSKHQQNKYEKSKSGRPLLLSRKNDKRLRLGILHLCIWRVMNIYRIIKKRRMNQI